MLRTITIPKYYLKIIRHLNSLLFPGIIQIETKFFALFIDSLLHDHREFFRHCSIYTSLSQNLYQQLLQVAFFKHTSDIPGISAFISMMRNCGILFPVWMLICRNDFCTIRNQKFHLSAVRASLLTMIATLLSFFKPDKTGESFLNSSPTIHASRYTAFSSMSWLRRPFQY